VEAVGTKGATDRQVAGVDNKVVEGVRTQMGLVGSTLAAASKAGAQGSTRIPAVAACTLLRNTALPFASFYLDFNEPDYYQIYSSSQCLTAMKSTVSMMMEAKTKKWTLMSFTLTMR